MYTYIKHMYTLVHKRIYETEEACQHYETALCKCILDVNYYRAHQETSLWMSVVTIATIVHDYYVALIHVTLYEIERKSYM